ncbi:MAG: 3-oxoacyl-[acyl-carrier-protein] reductase [Planctomycetota bacterium]
MTGKLAGKSAIVTGASRGIGRAIALELAQAGARVGVLSTRLDGSQQVANEIRAAGGQAEARALDVADAKAVQAVFDELHEVLQGLSILVNNAGITKDALVMRMADEDFDRVIAVDLRGMFLCCRAAARHFLKARAGRVINIGSVVGLMGNAGQANYAAAKAGVIGLTKSLAKELGSRGITVNAIAPGFITTDMTANLPAQVKDESLKGIPLQRFGTPEDIAHGVAFLASDEASYITGQVLVIDGGMCM